jgi:hypothetical protein
VDLTMTKEERTAFLTATPRVGVLSIETAGRGPVSSPLWSVLEGPVENRGTAGDELRRDKAIRYLRPELGEAYFQGVKDESNATLVLRPQRWATLDYNKLFA